MKYCFGFMLLLLFGVPAFALDLGSISGVVTDKQANTLVGISVGLQGTTQGTTTDLAGNFRIGNLPYGEYVLLLRGVGFSEKVERVTLSEVSPHIQINITLTQKDNLMQEVLVLGRKETNYVNKQSFIGTKIESRVIDVPQTISSVTKELIEEQQAFQITEVVNNLAGVNQYSSYDDLTIRGFRNGFGTGFRLVNGLRSGYGYGTSFFRVPLTVNLESIEVLKGPGAALFGDINPGGTVNLVTKKPLEEHRKAVNFSVGSFQTVRTAVDLTGPLNEDKSLLYRLNVGFEDTKTFRDVNDRTSLLIAPTVTFRPTSKTTVNAELVYSSFNGFLDRGMGIRGGDFYALPRSFTLSQPSDYYKVKDISVNATLNHKLTDWLSFNAAYLKFIYHEDLSEHRTLNTFADAPANTIMNMRYMAKKISEYTDNIATYFSVKGHTGQLHHHLIAGLDHIKFQTDQKGHQWEAREMEMDGKKVPLLFDLNKPTYELRDPSKYIRRPLALFFVDYLNSGYSTTGVFVQDQIKVTERLKLLLGLRQEFFRDQRVYQTETEKINQNVLLPRAGLTYKVRNNINYFASYSQGYKPIDPAFVRNPENYGSSTPFKSETSFQAETGLKGEFLQEKLFATLAFFYIEKKDMLVNTGLITDAGNPIYRQNGRVKSQGTELELTGRVTTNLSLNFNYAFNQTQVLESDLEIENGKEAPNAPRHSSGLWAKYTFTSPELQGFGFAFGGNYVGNRRMELPVDAITTGNKVWQYWPSYTVVNAALFYQVNKFRLSANLNNIFNKYYFVGGYDYVRAFPGAPRNIMTSVGFTF